MRYLKVILIALLASSLCLSASAEPVLIHSATQAKGQGWLFGSPRDASCWIAVPKHVIAIKLDGPVANFRWQDAKGYEGTGVNPVVPSENLDLAFARAQGREAGSCLSRLGVADISAIVARQPVVEAISMQRTQVAPRRMILRDYNGDVLRFEPATQQAKNRLQPGLSGAPLVFRDNNADRPVGMVIEVGPNLEQGYALRFDVIRNQFATIGQLTADPKTKAGNKKSTNYNLVNVTAESIDTSKSAASLSTQVGCWAATPTKEARSFRVEIVPTKPEASVASVALEFDDRCGAMPDSMMLEAQRGQNWTLISDCPITGNHATCNAANRKVARLRLTFIKRDGATVGISNLKLLQ